MNAPPSSTSDSSTRRKSSLTRLGRRDQVALPDLHGVDPQLRGDGVDQPLAHEGALISAGRAIGGARRLVGQAEVTDGPEGGNAVANWLASHYSLDFDSLNTAYEDIPDSLVTHFDTAREAKQERNEWIGWSIGWVVFFWPAALYTGYRAYDENQTLDNVKDTLSRAMDKAPS